jgi:hypothetical protein
VTRAAGTAGHNLATGNADVDTNRATEIGRDQGHAAPDIESCPDASLRVVAIGDGGTEDSHHAIADVLVDSPAVIDDACVGKIEEASEEGVDFLSVQFVGELRVAGDVSEQDCHLPPLGLRQRRSLPQYRGRCARIRRKRGRGATTQRYDRGKQLAAVAHRGDANPDQIVGRQVGKDLGINVVLAERLFVLPQPQTVQPSRNIHGRLLAGFLRRAPRPSVYPKISRQALGNVSAPEGVNV